MSLPLPMPEKKKPWYKQGWGVALIASFVLFAYIIGNESGNEPQPTAIVEEEEPAPEPEETAPEPEETAPEPEETAPEPEETAPEPDHDWPSASAYRLDLMNSSENVAELLGLVGDAAGLYGFVSDDDLAESFDLAATVITSHIDHFEGTTPPAEFAESQRLLLEGWDLFRQAWTQTANGLRANNPSRVEDGLGMMERGIAKVNEATAALP